MFFPRLRRRARWVFLFIALTFALGFLVAGVGTGLGSGLGDYLSDVFNRQPAAQGPSAEEARERAEANPKDARAQLDLANALQAEGKTREAIAALERYVELRPRDEDALQQLAGLYLIQASEAERRVQGAQLEAQRAFFGNELRRTQGKLAKRLGADPLTSFVQQQTSRRYSEAVIAAQEGYRKESQIWKKLTTLSRDEPKYFLELGRSSQQGGDTQGAIRGYERFLALSPDAPEAPQVRQILKLLKRQSAASAGAAPPGGG